MSRQIFIFTVLFFAVIFSTALRRAQSEPVPFDYPDPKTVGVAPLHIHGKVPAANLQHQDRYAKISEAEIARRIYEEKCQCEEIEGFTDGCPLCKDDPKTPCGKCKMCLAGFPCEKTLCRHCVQPRSMDMGNSCDLTAGDEPCGTCDACREHRSDPCEHADDGWGPRGEFNPYKEPRPFAVLPRPVVDLFNNGARKFPVYYNPAPYYRPHWNPSMFAGYARPFTFRWSCPLCHKAPCECDTPGMAGQVPYAYTCKFCNRNPCACAQDICDVNQPMNPKGISTALAEMNAASTAVNKAEDRTATEQEEESPPLLDDKRPSTITELEPLDDET